MPPPFSAVLLAAGRSTRMGREKAVMRTGDQFLWERQRDVLAAAGASEIFLSARPDQEWTYAAAGFAGLLHDALPGCGPLSGITAGIERASHELVAVLAIDLPRMTAEWFARLVPLCAKGVGAVGRRENRFEPLAAIYSRALMHDAWQALAATEYGLQPLLTRAVAAGAMCVHEITPAEAQWFENWNAPQDVA